MNKIKQLYLKYEEVINYLIFGFLTTVVSVVTYLLFVNIFFPNKSDLDVQIANVLSWICAVLFAYITNRIYVFKSKSEGQKKLKEVINFFLSRIFTLLAEMASLYLLFSILHIDDAISKIISQVIVIVLNYVLSKILVFKKAWLNI